jgi:site-specific recombinase XerD
MKIYSNLIINFWLRTTKNHSKNKEKSIYCRLIVNNERVDLSTNLKVHSKDWCNISERIKAKASIDFNYNSILDEMSSQLVEAYNALKMANKPISITTVKNEYHNKINQAQQLNNTQTIQYIIDKFLETIKIQFESNILSKSTYKAYLCTSKTFSTFLPTEGLNTDITPDGLSRLLFMKFEKHLIVNRKQNSNSAYRVIKQLRRIFNFAYENNLIAQRVEIKSSLKYKNPDRKFLTLEEVQALEKYEFSNPLLEEVKDVFLFSIYTGFAYNELSKLSKSHIKEINGRMWISISRQKTGNEQKVPLLPIPIALVEKYSNHPKCIKSNKLLPIRDNITYNKLLKDVQALLGIGTKLTTHIGRHTFATTIALCNGLSIETLSKILSHTSIKVTQIYAKVVDSKVIEDFDKLNITLNHRLNGGEVR